jgi:predicted nucleic acid-binding protein
VVLVDTSVWIEVFRKPAKFSLESAVEFDEVVTCLPVVHEVLQGFHEESAFALARDAMLALPTVESPLRREVFLEATELYRRARGTGRTVRSGIDCLIAACAIRNSLTVLHRDRDFDSLAAVSGLEVRSLSSRR